MSEVDGKQLSYAALTGPIFVNGVGTFGPSLSTSATGTKVTKMTIREPWVLVEVKNDVNKTVVIPIPCSSFTHTVLA